MVNILNNYRFLFTFTTAVVSFLPIVSINANPNDFGVSCNAGADFYVCGDGKEHTIQNKNYHLKGSREGFPDSTAFSAISVEQEGTVVNASQINVTADPGLVGAYGAYVRDGGKLTLNNSSFRNIPGLRVQKATMSMKDGVIAGTPYAVYALGEKTNIDLVRVNIAIERGNFEIESGEMETGFFNALGASVKISDSSVTFDEIGAFSINSGGQYSIDTTNIKGKGARHTIVDGHETIDQLPKAFDIFQGGDVQLKNSSMHLDHTHGFFITNLPDYVDSDGTLIQPYDLSGKFKKINIEIEKSDISVQGQGVYGFRFNVLDPNVLAGMLELDDMQHLEVRRAVNGAASVYLSGTTVNVPDGIAIYSTGPDGYGAEATIELSERTRISGDLLLKAENNSSLLVKANDSTLTGGIRVEDASTVNLELTRGSTWLLTKSKDMGLQGVDSTDSAVSSISLSDSRMIFDHSSSGYQTLRIGPKSESQVGSGNSVYSAKGDVQITLSAFLNDEGFFDPQKTDRILIDGDVSGTTLLQIEDFSEVSKKAMNSHGSSKEIPRDEGVQSVSLIQVSGIAKEDSFKLSDNYIAMNGLPYQYRLRSYGPNSSYGKARSENRVVAGEGEFWDVRLEGVYLDYKTNSSKTVSIKPTAAAIPSVSVDPLHTSFVPVKLDTQLSPRIRAVVPQLPTYLLIPNALFHGGFIDLTSQNKKFEAMRNTAGGSLKSDKNSAFFVRGYGGSYHYDSNLSAFEYGYGAKLDYTALEAGVLLKEIESLSSRTFLGITGTYGSLSLHPENVEYSKKSSLDKWAIATYGSFQHDTGLYMDGMLSYGLFKGDVSTLARGKAATLKGKQFSTSLTGGKAFATGYKGVVFDPQMQVIYQHLQFDRVRDVDHIDVDLGKFAQWTGRIGARLSKTLNTSKVGRVVSLYSTLYFSRSFVDRKLVSFKKDFKLSDFGSPLEVGLGFNAQLSPKLTLHGDIIYQHRLTKAGFSGASFSAGLRHLF